MTDEDQYPSHGEYIFAKLLKSDIKSKKYRARLWERSNKETVQAVKSLNREPIKTHQREIKLNRLNSKLVAMCAEAIRVLIEKEAYERQQEEQLMKQASKSGITLIIKKANTKANARRRKR